MAGVDVDLLKSSFTEFSALEEKAVQSDFILEIASLASYKTLIQTTQAPPIGGEFIEGYTSFGLKFYQYTTHDRAGQISFTILDSKDGRVEEELWNLIINKIKTNAKLYRRGEGYSGKHWQLTDCKFSVEQADYDVSAKTTLLARTITMAFNWSELV